LFSALGLLPLACGGAFSAKNDGEGGDAGTANGGTDAGGSATTACKSMGGKATGGKSSGGSQSGGGATGGANTGGANTGGATMGGATMGGGGNQFPCDAPMPAGDGYERCDDGTVHRPAIKECTSKLPRPPVMTAPTPQDVCASDADCTMKPHGYCVEGGGDAPPGLYCEYGCVKDSECGDGQICVCGDPVGQCAQAKCKSDADCGAGLRCQSYDSSNGCGILAFACQTPADTCASEADCAGEYCDASAGKFSCVLGGCAIGRPFLVAGVERVAELCARADWSTASGLCFSALPTSLRQRAAEAWTRVAQMEHASIAAFARFALQLLQLGAPPELVQLATAAMADETRHAQQAFGVASLLAGRALGPAALDVQESLVETALLDVVRLAFREGCIGETCASLEAREAAEHAAEPELARLLHVVADDETRHAELAWRFVGWALARDPQVAEVLQAELSRVAVGPAAEPSADELVLLAHGVVPQGLQQRLRAVALKEVITPCCWALLGKSSGELAENPLLWA